MALPEHGAARKRIKPFAGFLVYFPDAIAAVAELSHLANEKHCPGQPLQWDKSKSAEQRESQARHLLDEAAAGPLARDTIGDFAVLHATANAWRALAQLQTLADEGHNIFAVGVGAEPGELINEAVQKFVVALYRSDSDFARGRYFAVCGPFDTYKAAEDYRRRNASINDYTSKVIPYQENENVDRS